MCLVCLGASGCGARLAQTELADMRKKLDETQRRDAASQQKIDELENRVFLLTDQVESAKVAASRVRAPRLPVVTLRPGEDGDDNGDIEFDGAARSRDVERVRPSLHLEGSAPGRIESPTRVRRAVTLTTAERSSDPDNLGVAPAPPISRAVEGTVSSSRAERSEGSRVRRARGEEDALPHKDAPPPPAEDPLRLYQGAYDQLRAGDHEAAAQGFREFVKKYPQHDYADNAQYWLGETFYGRKRYADAAPEFRAVVKRYPLGNKAPDALLKLGYCLVAQGDAKQGRTVLEQVPSTYPRTEAARLAQAKLAELGNLEGVR